MDPPEIFCHLTDDISYYIRHLRKKYQKVVNEVKTICDQFNGRFSGIPALRGYFSGVAPILRTQQAR